MNIAEHLHSTLLGYKVLVLRWAEDNPKMVDKQLLAGLFRSLTLS